MNENWNREHTTKMQLTMYNDSRLGLYIYTSPLYSYSTPYTNPSPLKTRLAGHGSDRKNLSTKIKRTIGNPDRAKISVRYTLEREFEYEYEHKYNGKQENKCECVYTFKSDYMEI
jgi:hypothetical protein